MSQTIQILGKGVALILLLACVLSSIILGRSLQQMRKDQEGILVKGVAEMEIVSDLAMWTSSISIRSLDLAQGYALLGEQTQKALDYLKDQGIEETQVELATISVSTSYKRGRTGCPDFRDRSLLPESTHHRRIQGCRADQAALQGCLDTHQSWPGLCFLRP